MGKRRKVSNLVRIVLKVLGVVLLVEGMIGSLYSAEIKDKIRGKIITDFESGLDGWKVPERQKEAATARVSSLVKHSGKYSCEFSFKFEPKPGDKSKTKFAVLWMSYGRMLPGKPEALGVWVHGDKCMRYIRFTFQDSTGENFIIRLGRINFKGWKFMQAKVNSFTRTTHWSGNNDGVIDYPIRLFSLQVVGWGGPGEGKLYFDDIQIVEVKDEDI